MVIAKFFAVIILGYLIGSIPCGVLIGRRYAGVDVRNYGSGKMGATNVLRTVGTKAAIFVGALDILKGVLPAIFAWLILKNQSITIGDISIGTTGGQVAAALAAVIGHSYPVFLKFRGGRGVATFFGGLLAICPVAALFGGEVLIISVGLTRLVSFGSIVGAISTYAILVPLTILNGFSIVILAYALIGAILIIVMHRDNIVRLFHGKERKLFEKVEIGR